MTWLLIAGPGYVVFVALVLVFFQGACGKRTPAPPARPRVRLVQSRARVGVVEVRPGSGDAQNAQRRVERRR
jgi:hypothetical protein